MNQTLIRLGASIFIAAILLNCGNNQEKNQKKKGKNYISALDLDERLHNADSIVLVFYKNPYGEDSLRYTRYYTQVSKTSRGAIDTLLQQLTASLGKQEKRRNCRGDGKIWCFAKGKIFQTVYFSIPCENNCCYLYLIKDGYFYYSAITPSFTNWLLSVKTLATEEPPNEGIGDGNQETD